VHHDAFSGQRGRAWDSRSRRDMPGIFAAAAAPSEEVGGTATSVGGLKGLPRNGFWWHRLQPVRSEIAKKLKLHNLRTLSNRITYELRPRNFCAKCSFAADT